MTIVKRVVPGTIHPPAKAKTRVFSRVDQRTDCEAAVIGAGPYGLAVSAHLRSARIETRTFGRPMSFWQENMPKDMIMRSPWRGSDIADAGNRFSLNTYARISGIKPRDQFTQKEFVDYGLWFQQQAVPDLDHRQIVRIEKAQGGFRLIMNDGEKLVTRRVILAMGLANQDVTPPEFKDLPAEVLSHTADHTEFSSFTGRRVAVIGRGQSACESAALLSEAGADVTLITRGDIHWLGQNETKATKSRNLMLALKKYLTPPSEVGPVHLNWLIEAPDLYRRLPADMQDTISSRCLLPAASGWLVPRFGGVQLSTGVSTLSSRMKGDEAELQLSDGSTLRVDHVLLGTGYHVDISRYGILSPGILQRIDQDDGSPLLAAGYESSVKGMHFVGSSSCKSFGPLMRFVWGSKFTARCLTRSLLRNGI